MKRFTEQFNKESQKVRMRGFERADLRERLTTYMEYHPLPAEMRTKNTKEKQSGLQVRELFTAVQFNNLFVRSFVPTIMVLVVVAIPVLAERAAPGDVLYPVKVRFNEEMRSRMATSPYEEIEWEAERIERRIAEARLLANEGKLTPDLEAEVAAAVKEQTEKTKSKIAALKTTDADEGAIAEITLASALEVQNEMLEADAEKNKAAGIDTGTVLASVVAEESSAATAQQEQSKPSYEKLLARIETETTNAHEFFSSIEPGAQAEEVADIENRLASIANKVHKAQQIATADQPDAAIEAAAPAVEIAALETATTAVSISTTTQSASTTASATNEVEADPAPEVSGRDAATTLLREALTDIRKLISFMTNIDVRESVTVDE